MLRGLLFTWIATNVAANYFSSENAWFDLDLAVSKQALFDLEFAVSKLDLAGSKQSFKNEARGEPHLTLKSPQRSVGVPRLLVLLANATSTTKLHDKAKSTNLRSQIHLDRPPPKGMTV
jgi:hypothetical protein